MKNAQLYGKYKFKKKSSFHFRLPEVEKFDSTQCCGIVGKGWTHPANIGV